MANFNLWIDTPGKRRYNRVYVPPLYSNSPNDKGNFNSLGQNVGTMRSISAPAWESVIGHPPTAAEMQAITAEQAKAFYKEKIWDKVRGDSINNQLIAEMFADMKSSAGYNAVKVMYRALGQPESTAVTDALINSINAQNPAVLYEKYRLAMIDYYISLNSYWESGHLKDMDRYYPKKDANDPAFGSGGALAVFAQRILSPQHIAIDFVASCVFVLVIFAFYRFWRK